MSIEIVSESINNAISTRPLDEETRQIDYSTDELVGEEFIDNDDVDDADDDVVSCVAEELDLLDGELNIGDLEESPPQAHHHHHPTTEPEISGGKTTSFDRLVSDKNIENNRHDERGRNLDDGWSEEKYFALSLVGPLQRLSPKKKLIAKINILKYLAQLEFSENITNAEELLLTT